MRTRLLGLLLGAGTAPAAAAPFDFGALRYAGLPVLGASRARIVQRLGVPARVWRPRYECGFFSEDGQGKHYYALRYARARSIGNVGVGYALDHLTLAPGAGLRYGRHHWSTATTLREVQQLFGPDATTERLPGGGVRLAIRGWQEAVAHLVFRAGRLCEYELWTPC